MTFDQQLVAKITPWPGVLDAAPVPEATVTADLLHELPQSNLCFSTPELRGTFHINLRYQYLEVITWKLELDGTQPMYVVTHEGAVLSGEGPA